MIDAFRHALIAALILPFLLSFASAAELNFIEPGDRISASSSTTYLDLALQFAPGLATTPADGAFLATLRHLGGPDMRASIASPTIRFIERIDMTQNGKPALLLLFDFGNADDAAQSVSVLALYDMESSPRLIDAMDVGLDRETSFQEPRYTTLSPDIGMIFLRNSHHNAGEEFVQTSLVGLWKGKLHDVDTVMSMSWNDGSAQVGTTFAFAPAKDAIAVDATVEIRTTHCDGGCEPDAQVPATIERLNVRYAWDAASEKFRRPDSAYDRIPLPDMEQ